MMKKNMIKLAAGAAAVLLMSTSAHAGYTIKKKVGDVDTKFTLFGFSQLEARGGDGIIADGDDSKVAFGAQRIRLGWKYVAGKVRGKVFLDFNQNHDDNTKTGDGAAMPSMIKDAFITYLADPAFAVKLGLIKMPNGMSFTMPGWNLDITERGFDKQLVLERNTGLMISGRGIGFEGNKVDGFEMGHERPWKGFGYDVMIANQANRSKAASSTKNGGNSYALRAMFDYTESLHLEASYALSENAAGPSGVTGGEDYSNINLGVDSNLGALSLKAEYFNATNIKGTKDFDEQVVTATVGYFVTDSLELVTKAMSGSAEGNGADTDLTNTYLGFNYFLSSPSKELTRKAKRGRNQHKVVFNYVVATGDTAGTANVWNGLGGYTDDAFIAQYQFKF